MKYYLIAGEASGDLHASRLMAELRDQDPEADFRFYGGELMQAEGGTLVRHYRDLAYMGFLPVLLHLKQILQGMSQCQKDIVTWNPDVVILVDYPGFNLKIARFLKEKTQIPVFYYIAPKIWAWKEYRAKAIRRDVEELFCILPFETDFFQKKHHICATYVGNPSLDEVQSYLETHPKDETAFRTDNHIQGNAPVIALLPGSRRQEISANLPRMIKAVEGLLGHYELVIAAAPNIPDSDYQKWTEGRNVHLMRGQTYRLLQHSTAALVTSGTATLETALFGVPQVVCYYMWAGKLASLGRKLVLKIPFISLVNLIAGEEVVSELVAEQMNVIRVRQELQRILPGGAYRAGQLEGYARMTQKLGKAGAPHAAAQNMLDRLKKTLTDSLCDTTHSAGQATT